MQKLTILVAGKHTNNALDALRKLGVVHIKHLEVPAAERITATEHKISNTDEALSIIGNFRKPEGNGLASNSQSHKQKEDCDDEQTFSYIKEIIADHKEKQHLSGIQQELQEKIKWFEVWGNISPSSLSTLEKAGVFVKLYIARKNLLRNIPTEKMFHIIKREGKNIYLALISVSPDDCLGFPQVEVPGKDLYSLKKKYSEVKQQLENINSRLNELSKYRSRFLVYKNNLVKKHEFYKVKFGMAKEEGFGYLQGFCPRKDIADINRLASKEGWAVLTEEPDNPEETPTLIRNPRWVGIISPVFKFIGTLPGYKEYDISFWFLLFFSVFFALLIGDAGYGLIFLLITFLVKKKVRKLPPEPIFLMFVLGSATLIWGAITGNWFGFEKIGRLSPLNFLVIDRVDSFVDSNQMFMMYLSFLIGIIHLTVAHGIIAVRFINSLVALAQLGWIFILWGLFFVAGNLILDKPLPQITGIIFLAGIALVALFSAPGKNILKSTLVSLGDLPLKIISSFSDIVSYVRLFAVGYASVIVAVSFNNLASQAGFNNIFSGLLAALILFFGHSLNILLGLMAVIVHGVRLNMLEFSGRLNMQWSGKEYRPFRE